MPGLSGSTASGASSGASGEFGASAARVRCKTYYVLAEFPYSEIVRAAKRYRCDLIVMGSHGRRGISRLILGSQASKVLAHSAIPVLVVK